MTLQVYNLEDQDLKQMLSKVQNEGWAVFHEQELDESKLAGFFNRIGECETPGLFMNLSLIHI